MSYAIMPYKIRLDALKQMLASPDEDLCAWLRNCNRNTLDRLDEEFGSEPPAADVLTDLMHGRPLIDHRAEVVAYCVKILCDVWGAPLRNDGWYGIRYGWFDTVTAAVSQAGGSYDFSDLICGGPGVPVPSPDDFPRMGHVRHGQLRATVDRLAGADLAAIEDADVRTAVTQARGWLQLCLQDDTDLVCFYH
jgi:hypothetical protein